MLSGADHDPNGGAWSLAEKVKNRLADGMPDRYDVIHFAGHALFAAAKSKKPAASKGGKKPDRRTERLEDDRGYLIFGQEEAAGDFNRDGRGLAQAYQCGAGLFQLLPQQRVTRCRGVRKKQH